MSPVDKLLKKADDCHELSNFELRATVQGLANLVREMRTVSSNTRRNMVDQHGARVAELDAKVLAIVDDYLSLYQSELGGRKTDMSVVRADFLAKHGLVE